MLGERSGTPGSTAFALGGIEGSRQLGSLAPALGGRDLADPAVARAVQANAATTAIHQFAEKDALRSLGTSRSEEHTSELQSLMRISYAVFCLKKNMNKQQ